jgi:hypothetical protein
MPKYFVRTKGKDWNGKERTLNLEPFEEDDEGRARELGWAQTCQVSPLPEIGTLFREDTDGWKEAARVF